jgi:hypothetical protein
MIDCFSLNFGINSTLWKNTPQLGFAITLHDPVIGKLILSRNILILIIILRTCLNVCSSISISFCSPSSTQCPHSNPFLADTNLHKLLRQFVEFSCLQYRLNFFVILLCFPNSDNRFEKILIELYARKIKILPASFKETKNCLGFILATSVFWNLKVFSSMPTLIYGCTGQVRVQ